MNEAVASVIDERARGILRGELRAVWARTDHLFVRFLLIQWVIGLFIAIWISPAYWAVLADGRDPHIWGSVLLIGMITGTVLLAALRSPGGESTRWFVTGCQMLMSGLFIHLLGGRAEAHFHVLGSLAFLASYRDCRVLFLAVALAVLDHLLRGSFWPESVFGSPAVDHWQWLEHSGWLMFEGMFLCFLVRHSHEELWQSSLRLASYERVNEEFERNVRERTDELKRSEAAAFNMMEDARLAEQKAKDSEERFRAIIEAAPSAMIMVNPEGIITLVNTEAEDLFNYVRAEMLGQSIDMLVPARFRGNHPGHRVGFMGHPQARAMGAGRDLFGLRKDGSEVPVEIGLSPVSTSEGRSVLASIIDITDRKEAEEIIVSKNHELETLLYVISHDLREPLRTIQTFSEIVVEDYAQVLDEEGRHLLGRIGVAGARLERLLLNLLDVSRARRITQASVRVAGRELVDLAVERLAGAEASLVISEDLPDLLVDRTWGVEAIYNLLSNAMKYVNPGERPDIEVSGWRHEDQVGIQVADRGCGVPEGQEERIFELFQRGVGREVEGTGAGLAIVKEVALRHGGNAWVEKRRGGGSRFIITFGRCGSEDDRSQPT